MTRLLAAILFLAVSTPALAAPTLQASIHTAHKKILLTLEYATTAESRELGLMNRKIIGDVDGMLFLFPAPAPQKFWMKNTLIPLDMLFIDARHRIIFITTDAPLSETPVGPDTPVAAVIELDGGRAAEDGIAVGDKVTYALPANTPIE